MTLKTYPTLQVETVEDIAEVLREIVRIRDSDRDAFDNLKGRFIAGRRVSRIPSGSSDVLDSDRLGDFTTDADYIYILVDDSGSLAWRRSSLGSW